MKPAFLYFFALAFLFAGPTVLAQQWEPTNGPFGGGFAVYQNDNYVFAATPNGLYRTADTGLNWEKIHAGLPGAYSIARMVVIGEHLVISYADNSYPYQNPTVLFVSHDNGNTWVNVPLPVFSLNIDYITFDGQAITATFSTFSAYEYYHTSDDGQHWTPFSVPSGQGAFKPLLDNDGILYGANDFSLFSSEDYGATWDSIPFPISEMGYIGNFQVIDSLMIVTHSNNYSGPHYVSTNGGSTWTTAYFGLYNTSKIIKYGDSYYWTAEGTLYKQEIGSDFPTELHTINNTQKYLNGIAIQNGVFISITNYLYESDVQRSVDGGFSFKSEGNGMDASFVTSVLPYNGELYVSSQRGLQKIDPNILDWTNATTLFNSSFLVGNAWVGDGRMLVVSNRKLYFSANMGQSWTDIPLIGLPSNIILQWSVIPNMECKGDTIYLHSFRTTDFGNTWTNLASPVLLSFNNGVPNSFVTKGDTMFLTTQFGGFFRSDDDGVTWVQKNEGLPPLGWDGYLSIGGVFKVGHNLFVTAYTANGEGGFYRSQDNGESWEIAGQGLLGCLTCQTILDRTKFLEVGNYLMVNWHGQIYVSPDEGLHWIPYPTIDYEYCLANVGDKLFIGTIGDGLFTNEAPTNLDYHVYKGKVYSDSNDNGAKEPDEPWLQYYDISLENTPQSATTDSLGYFEFYAQFTSDTATVTKPSTSIYTNPPFNVISETDSIYMFGVRPNRYAEGFVYNDANNNGIREAGEQGLQGIEIAVDNGYVVNVTDANGHYFSSLSPAFDTIRAVAPNPLAIVHPEYLSLNIQDSIYNFGIYLSPDYPDLSLTLNASNVPGPGFTEIYYLTVKNLGAETGANLVFNFDPALVYLSTDYAPTAVNGNQIQWQLPSLQPLETFQISVYLQVPTTVPINSILNHNASVETQNATDAFLPNNVDSLTETVRGSFDPNDKQVWPEGDFTSLQIAGSEALNYKIRFQNTGNFPAEKVVILDTLATGLDPATMRIEAASHAYEWNILDGHIVEFIFDMINLPDSTSNEADSHGFVEYSILCKDSMRFGGIIDNTAYIYFDFNEPVATNTTNTAVVRSNKVQTQTAAVCEGELYEGLPIFADTVFTEIVSYPYFDSVYLTMVAALPVYDLSVDTAVQIGTSFLGHPISQDTTIVLNLLTVDGCDSTMTYHVSVWTALNGVEKGKYQLKVFPTIIGDLINIQSPTPIAAAIKANLYGPLGQKMNTWVLKSGVSRWQLDGLNLPPGLYFLSINIGETSHVFKLVCQ